MRKPILFARPQNSKRFYGLFFAAANFHVKPAVGITARFLEAWHRIESRERGRITLTRFGELLGTAMGTKPVAASTVGRWEKGALPDLESVAAIAAVSGVHPAWLAFGLGSPDDPVVGEISIRPERESRRAPETPIRRKTKPAPKSTDLPAVANRRKGS